MLAGLEDEQSRPPVALDLQGGLHRLDAQVHIFARRGGLDAQILELVAVLGVVVGPGGSVALPPADLFDPLGMVGQRLAGLVVFVVDVPASIRVLGQPQADEGIVEAPVDGAPPGPIGGNLEGLDDVRVAVE